MRDQVSTINDNYAGYKELKAQLKGPAIADYYKNAMPKQMYPFIKDWEDINGKKEKYQARKMRIFMRGVKIGVKRGGGAEVGMSLFEQKKKTAAAAGQKVGEEAFKASLSDESLGLTSEDK